MLAQLATSIPPLSPGLSTLLVTMFENAFRQTSSRVNVQRYLVPRRAASEATNASPEPARTSINATTTSGPAISTTASSVARPAQPITLRTVKQVLEWLDSPLQEGDIDEGSCSWDIFQQVVNVMSTGPHLKYAPLI